MLDVAGGRGPGSNDRRGVGGGVGGGVGAGSTLWIDARAGVAGDMLLGALLDAGAPLPVVRRDVAAVIGDAVTIEVGEVRRAGQRATAVQVRLTRPDQPRRSFADIRDLLSAADLPEAARARAQATFAVLAAAEARVHGVAVEEVHFHEVGAWDSIADVVGVCAALAALGVGAVRTTPVTVGTGHVRGVHGLLPVPVPAVCELLAGAGLGTRALPPGAGSPGPAVGGPTGGTVGGPTGGTVGGPTGVTVGELATPTGVALLVALAEAGDDASPDLAAVRAVGVGAGGKDLPGWANVVRVLLGAPEEAHPEGGLPSEGELPSQHVVLLEANVDDLDPRAWPGVLEAVLAAGAADAWLNPILMKKGRPAHTLSALVVPDRGPHAPDPGHERDWPGGAPEPARAPDTPPDPARVAAVRRAILTHTSTLGVRSTGLERTALPRAVVAVPVSLGDARQDVRVKVGHHAGRIVRATPEFEDCRSLAAAAGQPVAEALTAATVAARAAGLRPGADVGD